MRKKKTLTRKRRALRCCLMVTAMLAAYILLADYQFTVERAIQKGAREAALEPVSLLVEQRESSGVRLCLSRNKDAMQFLRLTFTPLWGWTGGSIGVSLDQAYANASINSYTAHREKSNDHVVTYWYGSLPPETTRLELLARPADDPPQAGLGGTISFMQKDFLWDDEAERWFFLVESPYDANAFVTTANVWDNGLLLAGNMLPTLSTSTTIG